jgi:hypothetical protein
VRQILGCLYRVQAFCSPVVMITARGGSALYPMSACSLLTHIIHDRFCCNRAFAATTSLASRRDFSGGDNEEGSAR